MKREFRAVNMSDGQLAEYDMVFKRMGEVGYRNLGTLTKALLWDSDVDAIITGGLRVVPKTGMTVTVERGAGIQRINNADNLPFVMESSFDVTMDAASGVSRIDIVEAQLQTVSAKKDNTFVVVDPETGGITVEEVNRDVRYFLNCRKKTGSTVPTAATAGELLGTVAIPGTIDLSEKYLIGFIDGEDGDFIEIDLRGSTPEATSRAEIIANINTALGRTAASGGSGDVVVISGDGLGETSSFALKAPATDSALDALELVFGLPVGGAYFYSYKGSNPWFKIAEISIGTTTTVITELLIKNIDKKNEWVSGSDSISQLSFGGGLNIDNGLTLRQKPVNYLKDNVLTYGQIIGYISTGAWTPISGFDDRNWYSVASDGLGNWVAVANGGTGNRIIRSTNNGATWTPISGFDDRVWISVASDGLGNWVAVASGGTGNRIIMSLIPSVKF